MKKSNFLTILICVVTALTVSLGFAPEASAQGAKQIKGRVLTTDNQPAVGAAVVIKGTTSGVVVDLDGNWEMSAKEGNILTVSMIGCRDSEITVGKGNVYNVVLEEDALRLDDVVVVAYGVQEKATITGAVNSIGSEEILRSPTANITGSLAGAMPGLTVVQRSGEPGKDSAILRVRGMGTLTDASASPLIIVDGVERENMDLIDANEVESINILKDASATAVYGVRGANGVVIITTKQGHIGKPQITFSANFGWQKFTQTPQLADGYEYATLYNEAIDNEGSNLQKFPQFALDAYKNHSNETIYSQTDWYKSLFEGAAPQQQYNINVGGGTEKVKYFFSFGLLHQQGMYKEYECKEMDYFNPNSDFLRYTFRSNVDAQIAKGLTLKLRLGAVFTDGNYNTTNTSSTMSNLLASNPFGMPQIGGRFLDGYTGDDPLAGVRKFSNPVVQFYRGGHMMYDLSKYNFSGELNYDLGFITEGLTVYAKVAYEDFGSYLEWYTPNDNGVPSYKIDIQDRNTLKYNLVTEKIFSHFGTAEQFPDRSWNVYLEGGLNYARSFGLHKITALALYNQRVQHNPLFQYSLPKGLLGFVGRVTYNYDNRYLAEVDLGYNGSENFAPGKRFGFFPAFSLGWILTEEKFIPKNDIVTYAKIRGSYGEVGNDQIGRDRFLYKPSDYTYPSNGYNFGVYGQNMRWYNGAFEGVAGNPNVTWERARKANIGLDLKMFKSRLSFSGDFFYEKRDNILWDYGTVPVIAGTNLAPANIGIVKNRGFELELGWTSHIGEVKYWANGNFSFARNNIVFKDEPETLYPWLMETGYSVGQYKGLVNEGFINTDADLANQPKYSWGNNWAKGDLSFVDVNGDGTVDSYDKVPLGYSNYPEANFGLNLGIAWKGFELSALLQGVTNVSCFLTDSAIAPFISGGSAQEWHMGRWTEDRFKAGEDITFPRVLTNMNNSPSYNCPDKLSSFWLMDASYLRLRNVELAYTIRCKAFEKAGISAVRLNVNGSNLLTWAYMKNFDPESPSGSGNFYPMEKVYNIGAKIVF